jgi:hypothetical protein
MSKYKNLMLQATERNAVSMKEEIFSLPQLKQMEGLITDRSAKSTKALSPLLGKHRSADSVGNQINKIISKLYTGLGSIPKKSEDVTNHVLNMVDKITNEKATASMSDLQIIYNELEMAHFKLQSEQSSYDSEIVVLRMIFKDSNLSNILSDVEEATITRQVDKLSKLDISVLTNQMGKANVTIQKQDVKITFNAIENFHRDLSKSVSGSDVSVSDSEFQSAVRLFRSLWLYLYGCVQLARETNAINPDETDTKTINILRTSVKSLASAEERLLGRGTFEDPAAGSLFTYMITKLADPEKFYSKVENICKIHSGMLKSLESTSYPSSKVYTTSRIDEIDLTATAFDPALYDIKTTPWRDEAGALVRKFGRGATEGAKGAAGRTKSGIVKGVKATTGAAKRTAKGLQAIYDDIMEQRQFKTTWEEERVDAEGFDAELANVTDIEKGIEKMKRSGIKIAELPADKNAQMLLALAEYTTDRLNKEITEDKWTMIDLPDVASTKVDPELQKEVKAIRTIQRSLMYAINDLDESSFIRGVNNDDLIEELSQKYRDITEELDLLIERGAYLNPKRRRKHK